MPRKDAHTGQISAKAQQELVSEGIENFELPKSIVAKIAKSAVCGIFLFSELLMSATLIHSYRRTQSCKRRLFFRL